MSNIDEIINNAVAEIAELQNMVEILQLQRAFLIGEMKNCKRIFTHEGKEGYALYVDIALKSVGDVKHAQSD